jgi:hypothetical protein
LESRNEEIAARNGTLSWQNYQNYIN